jgi:hypothetical protein
MSVKAGRAKHRAEYESIVASGIFPPHSNSGRFLEFVCRKYFEGQETVSEYEIAVEALGRRPDFDPKQDAIVREFRLIIPIGAYLPVFAENAPVQDAAPPLRSAKPALHITSQFTRRLLPYAAVLLSTAVIGAVLLVRDRAHRTGPAAAAPMPFGARVTVPVTELRIMAGSRAPDYIDRLGRVWSADRFFDGGEVWSARYRRIFRTADPQLYVQTRQGPDFGYNIPLEPGLYELRLYFAETFYGDDNQDGGGESSRIFTVLANGVPLITDFDPLSDAGGSNTATVRVFKALSPAPDGKLHLRFKPRFTTKAIPFVNAIEVIRTNSTAMLPIRWVASEAAAMDSANRLWQPDQFSYGGRLRIYQETVTGTEDAELYRSERYGHFSYAIPVAEGSYTLTLHFAEHWFDIDNRIRRHDERVFDVFCNGVALLRNFSIAAEAGGSLKVLKKTFRRLRPNAQGKLLLSFVPIRDYACINALEVVDESAR